jgi:predicted enzyme related to lactoylglutathione lyase
MPDLPKPGAVLFAKDLPGMAQFYAGVVGLSTVHSDADVIVLESANQQLVLHGIPKHIARSIVIASPPKRREDTAVKLVFPVASLVEARERAAALGGELNSKKKEFEARGFRACDGHDPEGNVVQFREASL